MNRNCKASLEKSSRCPYLLSLVLPRAQAVKQQKRGMFLYRSATATPSHHPMPEAAQPASLWPTEALPMDVAFPCRWAASHLFFPPCCIEAQEVPTITLPTPSSSLTLVGEVDTHCHPPTAHQVPTGQPALALGSLPPLLGAGVCLRASSLSTSPAQEVPHTYCSQQRMTLSELLDLEARPII